MSKLTAGEMPIMFEGEERILKPSLRAMGAINRQFGGLRNARAKLVDEDVDAVAFILRHGLNLSDRDARDLPDRIYRNGVTGDFLVALIKYVAILGNGGKPLPDEPEDSDGNEAQAEGNY